MGELRQRGRMWWLRYYRNGRRFEESAGTDKYRETARELLKQREGDAANGVPYATSMGRLRFDEAMADLETEYTVNKRDSLEHLKRRIALHLTPWFRGRRMTTITAADVNAYVAHRQNEGRRGGQYQPGTRHPEAGVHARHSRRQAAARPSAVYRHAGRTQRPDGIL